MEYRMVGRYLVDNANIYKNIVEGLTSLYKSAKVGIEDIAVKLPLPLRKDATGQDPEGPKPPEVTGKFGPLKELAGLEALLKSINPPISADDVGPEAPRPQGEQTGQSANAGALSEVPGP
jgi:hypothetical protein